MQVKKDTPIEDLIDQKPQALKYLMEEGIRCVVCGEAIWGTLEDAAREKGYEDSDIERFVRELNRL